MFQDVPALLIAATITTYWTTVILLIVRKRIQFGRSSGLLPRSRFERRLWLIIVPVVLSWIVLPVLASTGLVPSLVPGWAHEMALAYGVRLAAALLAVSFYLMSLYCWLLLGRHWSMAVIPGQAVQLVTSGIYRWVRHPIYSLSIGLMLATVVVLPVFPMALVACFHLIAMNLKARYEEQFLGQRFGTAYSEYSNQVGRFLPRWARPSQNYN